MITITINSGSSSTDSQVHCDPYIWVDGITYTSSNNTATHTLVGACTNGCDSMVTLNFTRFGIIQDTILSSIMDILLQMLRNHSKRGWLPTEIEVGGRGTRRRTILVF